MLNALFRIRKRTDIQHNSMKELTKTKSCTERKINKESPTVVVHFVVDGQLAIVPLNAIHAESIDYVSDYGS